MNKKMWDLYAPIYERTMRSDKKIYQFMYDRIPETIRNKDVLEITTGPGLLAKHVASASKTIIATDYSEGMIAEAKKGVYPTKLRFEVADATTLPYKDDSFDAVIISNALHIIKTTLKIDGMMCGMCEAHICDAIRNAVPTAKKVAASRTKKEASFLTEEPMDAVFIKSVIDETGYTCLGVESAPYEKKGLFCRK